MAENEQTTSMEFSWDNVEKEELITPRVSAIAVYRNGDGDIVIRQEAQYYQEEDEVVLVPIAHVEKLVLRLNELLEEANRA